MELVARRESHRHALYFYFHNFTRLEKTLGVIPAIAAGIADKVLHEVDCAGLINANQAPALRGPYKKRVTEIERYGKEQGLTLMSPVILRTEDRVPSPGL